MDLPRQHRHQIDHRGESFVVCCERIGREIRVWVERTSGADSDRVVLADGQTPAPDSADVRNEFAISAGDSFGLAEEVVALCNLESVCSQSGDSARRRHCEFVHRGRPTLDASAIPLDSPAKTSML
jgi:hypothetical protein